MIYASEESLDFDYVRHWLERIDSEDGSRLARLERLIASGGATSERERIRAVPCHEKPLGALSTPRGHVW
jgi:hypothetical protein